MNLLGMSYQQTRFTVIQHKVSNGDWFNSDGSHTKSNNGWQTCGYKVCLQLSLVFLLLIGPAQSLIMISAILFQWLQCTAPCYITNS